MKYFDNCYDITSKETKQELIACFYGTKHKYFVDTIKISLS